MNNYFQLVKINLKNIINWQKVKTFNFKKKVFLTLLAVYILFSVTFSLIIYTQILYDYLLKFGLVTVMMPALILLVSITTLIFSLFNAKNFIFNSKDDDLLLSLPLTKYQVMMARFTILYLMSLLLTVFLLLPAAIYYGVLVKAGFSFYFLFSINLLIIPIIPTILIIIVGYIVALVTSYFNKKNLIEIIFSLFLLFLLMGITANGEKIIKILIKDQELILQIIKYGFYPIYLTYFILKDGDYLRLVYLLLINIGLVIIFTYLLSLKYYQILSNLKRYRNNHSYNYSINYQSISKTLLMKELNRYFSSPIYFLNTSFGVIMLIIMAIATFFYDMDNIIKALDLQEFNLSIEWLVLSIILLVSAISNTTSSSISLEGKNFWIIKSLPLKIEDIFLSKILLNILIVIPLSAIAVLILGYNLSFSIGFIIGVLLILIITAVVSSLFGLLVNLYFPLLNFNNDAQVVKQSVSSLISILVPMTLIIGAIVIANFYQVNIYWFMLLVGVFFVGLIGLLKYFLQHHGLKKFQQLI